MKVDLKKISGLFKKSSMVFDMGALIVFLLLAIWFFKAGIARIEVKAEVVETAPLINFDSRAYKITDDYLKSIQSFAVPDVKSLYANQEPFREYSQVQVDAP